MKLLELNEMKKINKIADFIISNEMRYPLDSDLVLYGLKKTIKEPTIKNKNPRIKIQLSREELLKNVLNFFESIDSEYYNEALNFIIQLKKNKSMEIFYSKKENLTDNEKIAVRLHALNINYDQKEDVQILIPIGIDETMEERKSGIINIPSLQESFFIVHEIAHTFDKKKSEEAFVKTIDMDDESYKRRMMEINDSQRVRKAFTETTAIAFEMLFAEYLMGKYDDDVIKQILIDRYNNCLIMSEICCDNLCIANIKRKKGIIRNEDMEFLMREYNEGEKTTRKRIDRILRNKGEIEERKRYALAGLFAPTLVQEYKKNGVKVLKQYIKSLKNNSVEGVFDSIQVLENEAGYDKLFENMKKYISLYYDFKDKRDDIFER